jgi:hypothetical protein
MNVKIIISCTKFAKQKKCIKKDEQKCYSNVYPQNPLFIIFHFFNDFFILFLLVFSFFFFFPPKFCEVIWTYKEASISI